MAPKNKSAEQGQIGKWVQCDHCAMVVGPFGPITSSTVGATHGGSERGECYGKLVVTDGDELLAQPQKTARGATSERAELLGGLLVHMARQQPHLEGEHLGVLLKTARQEQGIPQAQVAERMRGAGGKGTQTTVGDAEREGPQLLSVAQKHAAALGKRIVFRLEPLVSTSQKPDTAASA